MPLTPVASARVICRNREGREVAQLELTPLNAQSSPIWTLDKREAQQRDEAETHLRENGRYWCELLAPRRDGLSLRCSLFRAKAPGERPAWLLETGAYVGLLRIEVVSSSGETLGAGFVEVRSVKLEYREQYRAMLSDLSGRMMSLLYDARSSSQLMARPAWRNEPQHLQQQIEFLRELLDAPGFRSAIQRVVAHPHRLLQEEPIVQPIGKPFKPDRSLVRQLSSGQHRVEIPTDHPLHARMRQAGVSQPSAPTRVSVRRKTDDLDTPENQFVKFVLATFRDFLSGAADALSARGESWNVVVERARRGAAELSHILSQAFFAQLSPLRAMPFGSPVLQRKSGYRELLQMWLRFSANAQVTWDAADDVFRAGKRDAATLYEYWLFFQLLDWFCERFHGAKRGVRDLMRVEPDGRVTLTLRHGKVAGPFEGEFANNKRRLKAQLSYNRTFAARSGRDKPGSWTRQMRPDYTLTFWPADFERLEDAEAQELAVHIHLDAKYRVDHLRDLFGEVSDNEARADDEPEGEGGNFKRADLLKMHAYRDAIRRSEGAFVLYPGTDADRSAQWRPDSAPDIRSNMMLGFHEILPGLGAFAIAPGRDGRADGLKHLAEFLDAVLEHLCNRATQREQRAYHIYNAPRISEATPPRIPKPLREKGSDGYRAEPPYEELVIAAWYEPDDKDWMLKNMRFVLRLGERRGSLPLVKQLAAASLVLLRSHSNETIPGLFRIVEEGGRMLKRSELAAEGYSGKGNADDIFAVFDVEPAAEFATWLWDGEKVQDAIEDFARRRKLLFKGLGRTSPLPRILSLADLIKAARF